MYKDLRIKLTENLTTGLKNYDKSYISIESMEQSEHFVQKLWNILGGRNDTQKIEQKV